MAAKKRSPGKRVRPPKVARPPQQRAPVEPAAVYQPPDGSKRRQGKSFSESEVSVYIPPPAESRAAVRHQAGLAYITDINRQTLEWWHQNRYSWVPYGTFRAWSREDHWSGRRDGYWQEVEAQLTRKLATETVSARLKALKRINRMKSGIARQIRKGTTIEIDIKDKDGNDKKVQIPVVPSTFKSREGAIRSYALLEQVAIDSERAVIGGLPVAVGAGGGSTDGNSVPVPFSSEELKVMAHARLKFQQTGAVAQPAPAPEANREDEVE